MFFDQFVLRVYDFLGSYIRERQREGALIEIDPAIGVRGFIGMVMHHSLNNNLWDPKRSLLKISNQVAARKFADILLNGVSVKNVEAAQASRGKLRSTASAAKTSANGRRNGPSRGITV